MHRKTRILKLSVQNLTRWENDEPLLNQMDRQTGYRRAESRNIQKDTL